MEKIKPLVWSDIQKPNYFIKFDHCVCKTPIGDITIKWDTKNNHNWPIIEAPWGAYGWGGDVDEAKREVEREYKERILKCFK